MASNGISTLPDKIDRRLSKINLARIKRQNFGTIGYRVLNYFVGTVSPIIGRPWSSTPPIPSGSKFVTDDDGRELITEDGLLLVTE